MKFFHVYNDAYFKGLEVNGLINEESGFKIQHVFPLPEAMKFNQYAAKGSKLHHFIKENNFPFYVDRIAGGVTYHKYEFDFDLIDEYYQMLGDWFLGFQLHESAGNRLLDWIRVKERMAGEAQPFDVEELKKRSIRPYAKMPDGSTLYGFSQGSPEEYASLPVPTNIAEFWEEMRNLYLRRQKETNGFILACDSFTLCTKMQDEVGIRTFMPEVGAQIPHMRVAVAMARGMGLAKNKRWGTYYETWRNTPGVGPTMPCFNKEPGNEWYLTQETHKDDFTSFGPNGGSSRLLQKRIYYYSLMSGAQFMAEEWGLNCSYNDMSDRFELSPYGLVKKEFINDSLSFRNVKAQIPFAIVLPSSVKGVHLFSSPDNLPGYRREEHMNFPLCPEDKEYFGRVEDVIRIVFYRDNQRVYGNERHIMQNSRFGDLFDIIYDDERDDVYAKYDRLVDASPDGAFFAKKGDKFPVLKNDDTMRLAYQLEKRAREILPLTVDSLHWLLSENEGKQYLSVFNNEGNERSLEKGDTLIPEADAVTLIHLKEKRDLRLVKTGSDQVKLQKLNDLTWALELPAAGFAIIQY